MTQTTADFAQVIYQMLFDAYFDVYPTADTPDENVFDVLLAGRRLRVTVTNEQEPNHA